jgi:hypothetical protein
MYFSSGRAEQQWGKKIQTVDCCLRAPAASGWGNGANFPGRELIERFNHFYSSTIYKNHTFIFFFFVA